MKSILAVLAVATSVVMVPLFAEAAPKYNERWQKVQEYRKTQVEKHRAWVASTSQQSQASAPVSAPVAKPVAAKPKPVVTTAAKKPVKRKKVAALSTKKRKNTSRRIGSSAKHLGRVEARVDLSEQKMRVYTNGRLKHVWSVSTARAGKVTPTGTYTAKWLSKNHRSSRYNGAPMPYSIFYSGNFAIHGTNHIKRLGRPASAGCVRLHPDNARVLFKMAQNVGLKNVKVRIVR